MIKCENQNERQKSSIKYTVKEQTEFNSRIKIVGNFKSTDIHREKVGRVVLPKSERAERTDFTIQVFIVL